MKNKMGWTGIIGWIVLIIPFMTACQSNKNEKLTLAKVENLSVTLGDFRHRLNNILLYTTQDNAEIRDAVLQNLINEKVLIHEAIKREYDKSDDFIFERKRFEFDAILNSFRDNIATKRVNVTEEDVKKAFALKNEQVRARILYAPTEEKAQLYYQQLQNGASFEQLAKTAFQDPRLAENGGDLGYFSWEDQDLPFSEAAQQLKVNEISKPVLTRNGWYVIKVEDRFLPPLSDLDYHKEYKNVKWIVTHRKKAKAVREYTNDLLKELDISFNQPVLNHLMRQVPLAGTTNSTSFEQYGLDSNETIATVNGVPWTLNMFYDKAQWTSYRQRKSVKDKKSLERFLEGLILRDILLEKAYAAGIQNQKGILQYVQNQCDLYLIEKMNNIITDTVLINDQQAREYYNQFKKQFVFQKEVNVREILVDSEEKAKDLLTRIRQGEKFADLAQKYSLRKWAAKRQGELGFGTKSNYGIHGDDIFSMKISEIRGPLKTKGYYSLVKVIDIREARPKTFEQARPEIEKQLIEEKKRNVLLDTIEKMRQDLKIEYDMNGIA